MKLPWFMLITLTIVPVFWAIGDRIVGMDTATIWQETPAYISGVVNGLCFGLFFRR